MSLSDLMQHAVVWRASDQIAVLPAVSTGHMALDQVLPGGGWPFGGLTELLAERAGIGELRLLIPALARLSRSGRWVALVAPPHTPCAPAFARQGVDLTQVLVLAPRTTEETSWAVEQLLRSGQCAAVLHWPEAANFRTLRRWQLAAEAGRTCGLLFRAPETQGLATPAVLRCVVQATPQGTAVRVIKRRGGWPVGPILLRSGAGHAVGRHPSAIAAA